MYTLCKCVGPKLLCVIQTCIYECVRVCVGCVCVGVAKIDSQAAGPIKLTAFERGERDSCVSGTGSGSGYGSVCGSVSVFVSRTGTGLWRSARVVIVVLVVVVVDVVWSTNLAPASHRISNCWQFVSGKKREPNIQIQMRTCRADCCHMPHATHSHTHTLAQQQLPHSPHSLATDDVV